MKVYLSSVSLSPYFNLASEQYMLEQQGDIFMLWRNGKSVIIGKNQNTYAEVNMRFCDENGIVIARRLTGGGAVFHDEGNVNFSFITDKTTEGIDFARFINPVCEALASLGINAEMDGRNDIVADGFKISGNAQCVFDTPDGRKRILHHGTLLFSADIGKMTGALNPNRKKLEAKGVKSVAARVRNIADFESYNGPRSPEEFMTAVISFVSQKYGKTPETFTDEQIGIIGGLAESKFAKWEWNCGKSPSFTDSVSERFPFGTVEIGYTANRGRIEEISINGDFFGEKDIRLLENELAGCRLDRFEIEEKAADVSSYISGCTPEIFASLLA